MTRLEKLCEVCGQDGWTIWDFNKRYSVDFLLMPDDVFIEYIHAIQEAEHDRIFRQGE